MASASDIESLAERIGGDLAHVCASCANWRDNSFLGVGTAPFLLVEPDSAAALADTVRLLKSMGVPHLPLGAGCNIAGSDRILGTAFIRLSGEEFKSVSADASGVVRAGAGASLRKIVETALDCGLGGASGLVGIPGSLGGAISMNAGAMGVCIGDLIESIEGVLPDGSAWKAGRESLVWTYRLSPLPEGLTATFAVMKFKKVEIEAERALIDAELRRRASTPKGRSAGCVFRNPSPETTAGLLLDKSGCKGLHQGGAQVSQSHANWVINDGSASESDFLSLLSNMLQNVNSKTGIALSPEVRFANMDSEIALKKAITPLQVAVLKGGVSSEREVSLESGAAVAKALRDAGHEVYETDIKELCITPEMRSADVVFPVLHGGFGENGDIQRLMEDAAIKFVGCPSSACVRIMDKLESKRTMSEKGIPTARHVVVDSPSAPFPDSLDLPVIVKPVSEGSTVGLSLVESKDEWKPALELAFKYGGKALVEEYFAGAETTVGIALGQPLPLVEIQYPGKLYDYDAKYTHAKGETFYHCPPKTVPEDVQRKAQAAALAFYETVGARDMLRVDVLIGKDGSLCVLEGNSIPGFTSSSLLPKAAKAAGISFMELCSRLAAAAADRN